MSHKVFGNDAIAKKYRCIKNPKQRHVNDAN